jgi:gliding motility-associated-like protein
VYTISGTPSVAGVFGYTVTTVSTCGIQSSFTGTITVNQATISLTSVAGTDAQKLCSNIAIKNITYSIGGTGNGANIFPALANGLISNYAGGILTISGIPIVPEGIYTYTITPTGISCSSAAPATFTITIIHPVAAFTTDKTIGNPALLVNFSNKSNNANTYNWSFGDGKTSTVFDTSYIYKAAGIYQVQLIVSNNSQCADTATTTIIVYDLTVPNVFSPNGDNVNDVFTINSIGVESVDVEIYNRWGIKVYAWSTPHGGWDGTNIINGFQCDNGTYYYILKETDILGKVYQKTGFVTLIR